MNVSQSNSFLAEQPVGALMRKFSLPCILSLLVGALYNIVDQLFIANASYLGSYGNAANSVVFPLTVIALAIAPMIGDGCCAYVSIRLGAGEPEQAHRSVGNAIVLTLIVSVVLTAVYLIFMDPILTAFGATVNAETFALSREYCFWIALGIPFYMFGQAMNPIIRSAGCIPVVGYNIGAGRRDRARALLHRLLLAEAVVGLVATARFESCPGVFADLFGAKNESAYYTDFAVRCIRWFLGAAALSCVNKGAMIYLQALGKAWTSTALSLLREIVLGVGLVLLLPVWFGLDGVLYFMAAADAVTFIVTVPVLVRTDRALRG